MRCHVTKWPNQAVGWCARELPQQGNNWCSRAWTSVVSPEALPHPASPNPQSSFLTPVSASTLTLTSLEPSPCLVIPRETLILLSCHPFLMTKATVYSSKGLSSCTFLTRLSPGPFPYIRCFYSTRFFYIRNLFIRKLGWGIIKNKKKSKKQARLRKGNA